MSSSWRANLPEFFQEKLSNVLACVSRWLSGLALLSPRTDQGAVSLDWLPVHPVVEVSIKLKAAGETLSERVDLVWM